MGLSAVLKGGDEWGEWHPATYGVNARAVFPIEAYAEGLLTATDRAAAYIRKVGQTNARVELLVTLAPPGHSRGKKWPWPRGWVGSSTPAQKGLMTGWPSARVMRAVLVSVPETKQQFFARPKIAALPPAQREQRWKQHLASQTPAPTAAQIGRAVTAAENASNAHEVAGVQTLVLAFANPEGTQVQIPDGAPGVTTIMKTVTAQEVPVDSDGNFHLILTRNPAAHLGVRIPRPTGAYLNLGQYRAKGAFLERMDMDGIFLDTIDKRVPFSLNDIDRYTRWFSFETGTADFGMGEADPAYHGASPTRKRVDMYSQEAILDTADTSSPEKNIPALPGDVVYAHFSGRDINLLWTTAAGCPELGAYDGTGTRLWVTATGFGGVGDDITVQYTLPANVAGFDGIYKGSGTVDATVEKAIFTIKTHAANSLAMQKCRCFEFQPVTPWDDMVQSVSAYRPVGASLLVTQLSTALNQGGLVASVNNQECTTPTDSNDNRLDYSQMLVAPYDRYDGNLSTGTYCYTKPLDQATLSSFRGLGDRGIYNDSYIMVAGKVATADGDTIRVRACLTLEVKSTSQMLHYSRPPVAPELLAAARAIVASLNPCVENNSHLKWLGKVLGAVGRGMAANAKIAWEKSKPIYRTFLPQGVGAVVGAAATELGGPAAGVLADQLVSRGIDRLLR